MSEKKYAYTITLPNKEKYHLKDGDAIIKAERVGKNIKFTTGSGDTFYVDPAMDDAIIDARNINDNTQILFTKYDGSTITVYCGEKNYDAIVKAENIDNSKIKFTTHDGLTTTVEAGDKNYNALIKAENITGAKVQFTDHDGNKTTVDVGEKNYKGVTNISNNTSDETILDVSFSDGTSKTVNVGSKEEMYNAITDISLSDDQNSLNFTYHDESEGSVPLGFLDNDFAVFPSTVVGDYITNNRYQPSCCVKVPYNGKNYMLLFNPRFSKYALATNTDNGELYIANMTDNVILDCHRASNYTHNGDGDKNYIHNFSTTISMGHANSCCYDSESGIVYFIPEFTYAAGGTKTDTDAFKISYFTAATVIDKALTAHSGGTEFNSYGVASYPTTDSETNTNVRVLSISYNQTDKSIYCVVDTLKNNIYKIYKFNKTTHKLDFHKQITGMNNKLTFNQDFAVNGKYFYLSAPHGSIYIGNIETGKIITQKAVDCWDFTKRWYLGELEGFEFDEEGILYAIRYSFLQSGSNDSFSATDSGTVAPVNAYCTNIVFNSQQIDFKNPFNNDNRTLTLSNESYEAFLNGPSLIRHPAQLHTIAKSDYPITIICRSNYNMGELEFNHVGGVDLNIYRLVCGKMSFMTGNNSISGYDITTGGVSRGYLVFRVGETNNISTYNPSDAELDELGFPSDTPRPKFFINILRNANLKFCAGEYNNDDPLRIQAFIGTENYPVIIGEKYHGGNVHIFSNPPIVSNDMSNYQNLVNRLYLGNMYHCISKYFGDKVPYHNFADAAWQGFREMMFSEDDVEYKQGTKLKKTNLSAKNIPTTWMDFNEIRMPGYYSADSYEVLTGTARSEYAAAMGKTFPEEGTCSNMPVREPGELYVGMLSGRASGYQLSKDCPYYQLDYCYQRYIINPRPASGYEGPPAENEIPQIYYRTRRPGGWTKWYKVAMEEV